MKDILISVSTLGVLGALFGILLGVFNEKFKVEESPLVAAIYEVLPHGELCCMWFSWLPSLC